jgi:hypothetical protein
LSDFRSLLEHVLARALGNVCSSSNVSMDTLDYTSGKINEGSKAILMGLGEAVRELPREFRGTLPRGIKHAEVFCAGCLVLEGSVYTDDAEQAARLAQDEAFKDWQLIVLHDDASVALNAADFCGRRGRASSLHRIFTRQTSPCIAIISLTNRPSSSTRV